MTCLLRHSPKLLRRSPSLSGDATHCVRRTSAVNAITAVEFPIVSRNYVTESKGRSPFDSNIIRILRTEIDYQYEHCPPAEPPSSFNSFYVEDRSGEQFVRLRRKFGENKNIEIEATMFDGCVTEPKAGEDNYGEDIRLHISLLVDIYKGEGSDGLGFVCSAWPDGLEILKVYKLHGNGLSPKALMGPNLRNLKLRKALQEYLEARGVNNDLSFFLHHYMVNKDRSELLRWLGSVKSFVQLRIPENRTT